MFHSLRTERSQTYNGTVLGRFRPFVSPQRIAQSVHDTTRQIRIFTAVTFNYRA